jgi:hypothetical protein
MLETRVCAYRVPARVKPQPHEPVRTLRERLLEPSERKIFFAQAWITRGTPICGREAALKRFKALYEGTWQLAPEAGALKAVMLGEGTAQLFVPVSFSIGAPGQAPQSTRFLLNQVLVKTPAGWKVSAILPIPAPAP